MKILYIEDSDEVRQLYVVLLDNIFPDVNIVETFSGNQAIAILDKQENVFDLIICDYEMPDGNGDVVYEYIKNKQDQTAFLLFSSKKPDEIPYFNNFPFRQGSDFFIQKSEGFNNFKEKILQITQNELIFLRKQLSFKKIRIYNFWKFNTALCDIFLRLSDAKYVKIIKSGDRYTRKDIEKYVHKKQKFLYIRSDDFSSFSVTLGKTPFLSFNQDENNINENSITTTHAMIHELVLNVGISPQAIKLAEKIVDSIMELTQKNTELFNLLLQSREKKDYIYDHSYLLSCICGHFAWYMNWTTSEVVKKLAVASLFHDLKISDPDLAMINDLNDPQIKKLTSDQLKEIKNHPFSMVELIKNNPNIETEVDTIILQHHEKPDGTGFPRKLSGKQIHPLACTFIIVHHFVDKIYECNFDSSQLVHILTDMKAYFNIGNFVDPMSAFIRSFDLILEDK